MMRAYHFLPPVLVLMVLTLLLPFPWSLLALGAEIALVAVQIATFYWGGHR